MHKNPIKMNEKITKYFNGLPSELIDLSLTITITGSLAHGLGTSRSDIDLLLITDQSKILNKSSGDYIINYINGTKGQIYILNKDHFLKNIEIFFSKSSISPTSLAQIDLMNKLLRGKPIHAHEKYFELISPYTSNKFKEIILLKLFSNITDIFEDLLGFIEDNRHFDLINISILLVNTCIDCLLVSLNDTYLRDKWRFSRLNRASIPESLKDEYYNKLFTLIPKEPLLFVTQNLYFANKLILLTLFPKLYNEQEINFNEKILTYQISPLCTGIKKNEKFFILTSSKTFEVDSLCLAIFLSLHIKTTFETLFNTLTLSNYFDMDESFKIKINHRLKYLLEKKIIYLLSI